jgi:DNA-binding NtrC family response regulator
MEPRRPKIRMIIIDDDKLVLDSFINQFSDEFEVMGIHWGINSKLEALIKSIDLDVAIVVADQKMPRITGIELLSRLRKERPEIIRILLTAYLEADRLVEGINEAGIFCFVAKPVNEDVTRHFFRMAGESYRREQENSLELKRVCKLSDQIENFIGRDARGFAALIGKSAKIREVIERARRVVDTSHTVLILGETGTGKELLAQAIHYEGLRRKEIFADMNCGLFKEELFESHLFGHERGSFTGAFQQRRGKLEIADGGTVFLDEVGDLSPAIQVKLLRVLETRAFERLGGTNQISVDIRLIAATNRNLDEAIKAGIFRSDLYYRLAVFPIVMPPLRERPEDVEVIARSLLGRFNSTNKRKIVSIADDALQALSRYSFPGNVRELRNAIEYAALSSDGAEIQWENLPETIKAGDEIAEDSFATESTFKTKVHEYRRKLVCEALAANQNRTSAAKILGISGRHLQSLIKEFGVD